jgi:crossover junction endodeoxyribonuclease RuvC
MAMSPSKNIFIGIDIGKSGGVAIVDEEGKVLFLKPMPDYQEFARLMLDALDEYVEASNVKIECTMEHVGAMPGEGVSSVFKFGYGSGLVYGTMILLSELYIPLLMPERISPMLWKKMFGLLGKELSKYDKKKLSVDYVNKAYKMNLTYSKNGLADALLIAEYSRRMFLINKEEAKLGVR